MRNVTLKGLLAKKGRLALTAVAIVLDRVPPEAMTEIRAHLASMLREQGLATAPIFGIPESPLTAEGRLPEGSVTRLKSWLSALAGDARALVVANTLRNTLKRFVLTVQISRRLQYPITRSTPARLYQLRSKSTTSPAAGRCGM